MQFASDPKLHLDLPRGFLLPLLDPAHHQGSGSLMNQWGTQASISLLNKDHSRTRSGFHVQWYKNLLAHSLACPFIPSSSLPLPSTDEWPKNGVPPIKSLTTFCRNFFPGVQRLTKSARNSQFFYFSFIDEITYSFNVFKLFSTLYVAAVRRDYKPRLTHIKAHWKTLSHFIKHLGKVISPSPFTLMLWRILLT